MLSGRPLRATFNTLVLVGETPGREALFFKGFFFDTKNMVICCRKWRGEVTLERVVMAYDCELKMKDDRDVIFGWKKTTILGEDDSTSFFFKWVETTN